MKKVLITITALVISLTAFAQDKKVLNDYINTFVQEKNAATERQLDFLIKLAYDDDITKLNQERETNLKKAAASYKKIDRNIFSYAGDSKLKKITLKLFNVYKDAYANMYKTTNSLYKKKNASYNDMLKYINKLNEVEENIYNIETEFDKTVQEFVVAHKAEGFNYDNSNYILLKKITLVNKHYRELFLSYFKAADLNRIFMQAVNEKNPKMTTEARKRMIDGLNKEEEKVKNIEAFNDDDKSVNSAKKLLKFYKGLAEKDYADLEALIIRYPGWSPGDVNKHNNIIKNFQKKSIKYHGSFQSDAQALIQSVVPKKLK